MLHANEVQEPLRILLIMYMHYGTLQETQALLAPAVQVIKVRTCRHTSDIIVCIIGPGGYANASEFASDV